MFSSEFWSKTWNDPAVFWVMATAAITVVLTLVAWRQLGDLARTSRADFIFRLKNDFFKEETRSLLFLVEENLIRFQDEQIPFFSFSHPTNPHLQRRLDELGIKQTTVSTYLMDDAVLGPLEDVSLFLTDGLITVKQAHEMFYTYIKFCAENNEIQKYIRATRRRPGDEDIYSGFDKLYQRLSRYHQK